jgi:hypothetical protein
MIRGINSTVNNLNKCGLDGKHSVDARRTSAEFLTNRLKTAPDFWEESLSDWTGV